MLPPEISNSMQVFRKYQGVFAACILSFAAAPLFAQGQVSGLSISPLTFDIHARPGETISNLIKVANSGSIPLQVRMEAQDFYPVGEEGGVALREHSQGETQESLASWIQVSPQIFTLRPGEKQEVQFSVSVPANNAFGGHYASILASWSGVQVQGGSRIAQKVGSLVLLQIVGQAKEELSIASFDIPAFSESGPLTFSSRFLNTGTVHVKPRGYIEVKNMFGKEIAKISLPQKNVLPDSTRKIDVPWDGTFLLGKYQANLVAAYGENNELLSQVAAFWVIPWKLLGAGLLGFVLMCAFLFAVRKRIVSSLRILFFGEKPAS